jgi:hypothetical protein
VAGPAPTRWLVPTATADAWHRHGLVLGPILVVLTGSIAAADLVGVNLGDAIWWTLVTLALSALPFGVLGAAAGSVRPRRRRARERAGLVPSS